MTKNKHGRTLKRLLGVASILAVGIYLLLFPPLPLIPEIGRNLPSNFEDAGKAFSTRVKNTFPPHTDETSMTKELSEQGFTIEPNSKQAVFSKSEFPCLRKWQIVWETDGNAITKIDASYGASCL